MALKNIESILALPIIHVQHVNIKDNATFFLPDTEGVKIHKNITPIEGEHVVIKNYPNSFLKTNLKKILDDNEIEKIVVVGMITHMCIDTTVRACMDNNLSVTLVNDACTTKNLKIYDKELIASDVHDSFMAALNGMFSEVINTSDFML